MSAYPEPPLRVPVIDSRTGLLAREWATFFRELFTRTGGTSGVIPDLANIKASISDLQSELAMQPDQTVALLALKTAFGVIDIAVESLVVQTDAFDLAQAAQLGATNERLRALENLQVFA